MALSLPRQQQLGTCPYLKIQVQYTQCHIFNICFNNSVTLSYTSRNFEFSSLNLPHHNHLCISFSFLHATHPAHHIISDRIYRGAKIMQFLVTQFLSFPTNCIPIRNECIVSSYILSTLTLYTFFNVRDIFPRPQKRRSTITFLSVLIFIFQTGKRNTKVYGTSRSQHFRNLNCAVFF